MSFLSESVANARLFLYNEGHWIKTISKVRRRYQLHGDDLRYGGKRVKNKLVDDENKVDQTYATADYKTKQPFVFMHQNYDMND